MFSDNPSPGNIKIYVDSVIGKTYLSSNIFPNSTLRGNAELGDNNQVEVTLVIYLLDK